VKQVFDTEAYSMQHVFKDSPPHRPNRWSIELGIRCEEPIEFALKLRIPWWLAGPATIRVNGQAETISAPPSSFYTLRRRWKDDTVRVELPKALSTCPLPDDPDIVAFMDGPVVLAGLCDEERVLYGDKDKPETLITPANERLWTNWNLDYRTHKQDRGFRLVPLYEVTEERYTVYFPIRSLQ
jgi:hypothetical protein